MSAQRLNKDECNEIANKMLSGISKEIKAIDNYFNDLNRQLLVSKVPEPILSLFYGDETLAKFIKTYKYGTLSFNKRYVYTEFEPVPVLTDNGRNVIVVPEQFLKKANKMYDEKGALETKKALLVKELEQVLFKLSTPKRITEHLPEALPYLPVSVKNQLPQINLSQFRDKLKTELGI